MPDYLCTELTTISIVKILTLCSLVFLSRRQSKDTAKKVQNNTCLYVL